MQATWNLLVLSLWMRLAGLAAMKEMSSMNFARFTKLSMN